MKGSFYVPLEETEPCRCWDLFRGNEQLGMSPPVPDFMNVLWLHPSLSRVWWKLRHSIWLRIPKPLYLAMLFSFSHVFLPFGLITRVSHQGIPSEQLTPVTAIQVFIYRFLSSTFLSQIISKVKLMRCFSSCCCLFVFAAVPCPLTTHMVTLIVNLGSLSIQRTLWCHCQ